MNSAIGLKNPNWDLNKSKYSEIDELPLMATLGPVLIILAVYLVFVLKVGPAYMRKREAYKLTHVMLVYNAVQVAISVYLVARYFLNLTEMGLVPKVCYMNDTSSRNKILMGTYLYLSAKFTELLDTVFFVLRKKESQVTFLHLYHHSVMVIGTWAMLKYWPSHTLIFIGFLNSLVHVFMYTYYGLAALGPSVAKYLTWKKYMTKFQLIQFVSIIIQYVATVRVSDCPPAKGVAMFISSNTAFFLILFLNFYRQSYNAKKNKQHRRDSSESTLSCRTNKIVEDILCQTCGTIKINGTSMSEYGAVLDDKTKDCDAEKHHSECDGPHVSTFIAEMNQSSRKYSLKND